MRLIVATHAKEATDADHEGFDLAGLVEQDVADTADLLIIRAHYVGAFELGCQPLIGFLLRHEIRLAGAWLGLRGGARLRCRRTGVRRLRQRPGHHQRSDCCAHHHMFGHGIVSLFGRMEPTGRRGSARYRGKLSHQIYCSANF